MEALNVQIINPKAKSLLLNLQEMNLIRIEAKPMLSEILAKTNEKALLLNEIREAVDNVNLVKKGKLQARPAKELLDEI